jgi:hypothetical protein
MIAAALLGSIVSQPGWSDTQCTVAKALGCYVDTGADRILAHTVSHDILLTQEACAALVAAALPNSKDIDTVVVGVEFGKECYWDVQIPTSAVKKDESECSMPCAGNASETCGGDYRIEVFTASCTPTPPQPPTPPPALPTEGPCDILVAAGNPCVAAHSTIRALYKEYDGPLYNLTRQKAGSSANESLDIGVLSAGGFANAKAQDAFCADTTFCIISNVYDQSPQKNHLGQRHKLVDAMTHQVTVGPQRLPVYGMWFEPGYGYHVDNTTGIATGNDPESIYAVMSGKHFNDGCCFDYGNSETDDTDDGCGTMEAIYFGNAHWHGNGGAGTGPWAGADLEQGMYYGGGAVTKVNNQSKTLDHYFVSLSLKGRTDGFTLKGGDATTGALETMYDGSRPDAKLAGSCKFGSDTYQPMRKEGAIILATGGDQSNRAQGNFYEGFMATGYASDATDAAIQANIIAVGYRTL